MAATMPLNLIILVIAMFFTAVGVAQEVRYIDLSGVNQPTTDEPYGSKVENLSCGGSQELFPHRAKVSLEWIESTDIYPLQRIGMEVRIENVGIAPIRLPVHPNLTDLQPKDPAMRFKYYSLRLPLEAAVPTGGLLVAWLQLYGLPTNPETFLTLKPGEWIRVRGDIVVRRWYASDQTAIAATDFWLSKYVFPADEKDTTIPSNQRCILPVAGTSITIQMHAPPYH